MSPLPPLSTIRGSLWVPMAMHVSFNAIAEIIRRPILLCKSFFENFSFAARKKNY